MEVFLRGEKKLYSFHTSRRSGKLFKFFFPALILILFPAIWIIFPALIPIDAPTLLLLGLLGVGGLLWFFGEIVRVTGDSYYITNYRVVHISGIMSKKVDSVGYDKIVRVRISRNFKQRLLGIGTIDITTLKGHEDIIMKDVARPGGVERFIYRRIEGLPIQKKKLRT